jgi:serine/threonine-protein kinase RsbW
MEEATHEWPATLDAVPAIGAWVLERASLAGAEPDAAQDFRLSVDEIVTNAITHGGASRLVLAVQRLPGAVRIVVRDDARPFDPGTAPTPDLHAPAETRRVGGLGWHLVHRLMHDVGYRALGESGNEVTLVRRLAAGRPDLQP